MESNIDTNVSSFFVFQNVGDLVSSLVAAAIIIAALASLLYLVFGGITWLSSAGDKANVEKAQKMISNALIGLAITISAFAIWSLATGFLGIDLLNGVDISQGGGSRNQTSGNNSNSAGKTGDAVRD